MAIETLILEQELPQRSRLRVFTFVSVLYAALFISAVNPTIVTTALPTIAKHFQSTSGYTWVGAAYVLADTASSPVWTNSSDVWSHCMSPLAVPLMRGICISSFCQLLPSLSHCGLILKSMSFRADDNVSSESPNQKLFRRQNAVKHPMT